MPVHMIDVGSAIFHIRLELLAYVATRRKLIKNFRLEFRKEVKYFISFFLGKLLKSSLNMAFGDNQKMPGHKPRIAKNDIRILPLLQGPSFFSNARAEGTIFTHYEDFNTQT